MINYKSYRLLHICNCPQSIIFTSVWFRCKSNKSIWYIQCVLSNPLFWYQKILIATILKGGVWHSQSKISILFVLLVIWKRPQANDTAVYVVRLVVLIIKNSKIDTLLPLQLAFWGGATQKIWGHKLKNSCF